MYLNVIESPKACRVRFVRYTRATSRGALVELPRYRVRLTLAAQRARNARDYRRSTGRAMLWPPFANSKLGVAP